MRTLKPGAFATFVTACMISSLISSVQAQNCQPTDERSAVTISREIAGNRDFNEYLEGPGWTFQLKRASHGWDLRLNDEDGLDLTQMTPPLRGAPNPRQIYGWHFRNGDNTGGNKGEVNAPQQLRLFGFDPALSGTGGFKASAASGVDPENQPGRGALTIRDMGLADLEPGQKARMNYIKFDVCMTWPKTGHEKRKEEEAAVALAQARKVTPELIEQMGSCGIDLATYEITAFLTPVELGGDFDGDDAFDQATPVVRKSDGKRGIAICRAGTWAHVIGMSGKMGAHLSAAYFDNIDWWSLHGRGPVGLGGGEGPPPTLAGDALFIGKEGASSALVYWDGEKFTGYWQGD